MSAGEFDYTVAGPAAWFDPDAFTSNVPGQAAGWFDYDYLESGIAPAPPPPKPKPPKVAPPQSTGGGGGGGWVDRWPPRDWSVNDAALRDKKLRELFELKVEAPIVKWVEVVEEKTEEDEDTKQPLQVFVENVVDTKTIFVPILIAAPPVVIYETRIPRWIGWTMVAVGATLVTVSLVEIASRQPKRKRRKRRR